MILYFKNAFINPWVSRLKVSPWYAYIASSSNQMHFNPFLTVSDVAFKRLKRNTETTYFLKADGTLNILATFEHEKVCNKLETLAYLIVIWNKVKLKY